MKTLFLLVAVFFVQFKKILGYTESAIQRLAQASSLSYLSMDRMESSPYLVPCLLDPIVQVVDDESESGATIFFSRNDNNNQHLIVVACRGSANPKNFGTNLKFNLVPATRLSLSSVPEKAMVHQGFQDASVGLWRKLGPKLSETLIDNSGKDAKLVFTGHSLGAATALLGAVHYEATFGRQSWFVSPSIITFGGPKLVNGVLARYLRNESLKQSDILHLVHSKDPVLANNQKLWKDLGFEDVGIELQCDPNEPIIYANSDGDVPKKKGFFGRLALNIMDHCNYMGVFVGPRF